MVGRNIARPKLLFFYCVVVFTSCFYVTVLIQRMRATALIERMKAKLNLEPPDDISCYLQEKIPNVTYEKGVLFVKNAVFMISTTCDSSLPLYAACAIEAVVNSQLNSKQVYVLSTKPIKDFGHRDYILRGIGSKYVTLVNIKIDQFVQDTPLDGIFKDDFLKIGTKRHKRVLEVLKLATLYKYGGVVVDLEMILAKPLENLGMNWAGKVNSSRLGSAILSLRKRTAIGRSLLMRAMKIMADNSEEDYLNSGLAITEAFQQLCIENRVEGCSHFKIYEPSFFYIFNSTEGHRLFENGSLEPRAFGYYIWDRNQVRQAQGSMYEKVMEEYCPSVYNLAY